MIRDNSLSSRIFDVFIHTVMIVVVIVTLYPVLHVLAASLSDGRAYTMGLVTIFPKEFTLKAYYLVSQNKQTIMGFMNSIFYTSTGTIISMLVTTAMAYGLSRKHLPFRRTIMLLVLFTMYFKGGMIPNFLLIKSLGIYNTIWALTLPTAVITTNLIILRSYFQSIPAELEESAYLDGANDFVIFFRIALPLSKAALFTIGLFYAVYYWNSWFYAFLYLRDMDKYPLQMILRQIILRAEMVGEAIRSGEASASQMSEFDLTPVKFATIFVSLAPMMVIYPFVQQYFVKGVMIGSLKN